MPTRYSDNFMDRVMLDHLTNPWFDSVTPIALGMLMAGLFLFWIWLRINRSLPYGILSNALALNGLVLLGFLRDRPFPTPLGIILTLLLYLAAITAVVALVSVFSVSQLPAYGVDEKYLLQPNGLVRIYVPVIASFVVFFLLWMFLAEPFIVFGVVTNLGSILGGLVAVLSGTFVSGLAANFLVPYEELTEETTFFVEAQATHQLLSPFRRTGDAGLVERLCFPIMWVAACALVVFMSATAEVREANWFGVLLLVVLATSILMTELSRARARGDFDDTGLQGPNGRPEDTVAEDGVKARF